MRGAGIIKGLSCGGAACGRTRVRYGDFPSATGPSRAGPAAVIRNRGVAIYSGFTTMRPA